MRLLLPILLLTLTASTSFAQEHVGHDTHSPYAADTSRLIKALAPDDIDGLLEGRGMGFALAAELNGYPGPLHVLELADDLSLTEAQLTTIQQIRTAMQMEAQVLGTDVVEMETHLDTLFADARATSDDIDRMTAHIAEVKGKLRAVHLRAHVATRSTLTFEQVALYNRLRGYTTD
ncbi:MAG: Spy/CpxP family protein refolding chaperone [Rubricoccaceae bacterium]|nr:Spy/CpxP family protein refolding chaperone [Rubricoccaceae bacterium]